MKYLKLTDEQYFNLSRIISFLLTTEEESFDEEVRASGEEYAKENHVYSLALQLQEVLEAPPDPTEITPDEMSQAKDSIMQRMKDLGFGPNGKIENIQVTVDAINEIYCDVANRVLKNKHGFEEKSSPASAPRG